MAYVAKRSQFMDLGMYFFKSDFGKSLSVCQKKSGKWKNPFKHWLTSKIRVYYLLHTFYKNTHWYNHKKMTNIRLTVYRRQNNSKNTREGGRTLAATCSWHMWQKEANVWI